MLLDPPNWLFLWLVLLYSVLWIESTVSPLLQCTSPGLAIVATWLVDRST